MANNRKCPAPLLSFKHPNFVLSVAKFYKRQIGYEDVKAINPTRFAYPHILMDVVRRLEKEAYVKVSGDKFQITEHGAQSLVLYADWKVKQYGESGLNSKSG